METGEIKWYQKSWFMWVMIIFFFPVGLFLLWKYSDYSKRTKCIITAVILGIAIFGGGNKKDNNVPAPVPQESTQQVAENSKQVSKQSAASTKQPEKSKQNIKQYTDVSADTLLNELEKNALAAANKYKDNDLKVTGILRHIDSDGDSIMLGGSNEFAMANVFVRIPKKELKAQVAQMRMGQYVTVYGNVFRVGDTLGYYLKADKLEF